MKRLSPFLVLAVMAAVIAAPLIAEAKTDTKGGQDHPLVTRMPGFYIEKYKVKDFDSYRFKTDDGKVQVEGRKYSIKYMIQKDETSPGNIQILRNYLNALTAIGAEVKLKSSYYYVFRLVKNDMETWIKVDPGNSDGRHYVLTIVERAAMVQDVTADATAMAKGISMDGHMAVYGIYFDTDKTTLKDDSKPALDEIAELLKTNPSLNLYVVGHTDSEGRLEYNLDLSRKRASTVVKTLAARYGIVAERLSAQGLGPLSPVASNRSPRGRARNRRVELVEK